VGGQLVCSFSSAQGERFIAVSGDSISMVDIAELLGARLGVEARRVPIFSCRIGW
jgi:hypothetical protein